jgi:probable F420-dependent oxidoreductase
MKIGLVINHHENSDTGAIASYEEMREIARLAESGGLDSIWLFDHLLFRFEGKPTSGIWECWTLLCALAEATSSVELGTIVLANPFRNPALLAKMAHTLDEISSGRLILGLGAGWHEPEFKAFGFPFDHLYGRIHEALQIIHPLLHKKTVTFQGDYYQVQECVITPPGPRPSIPLLVGCRGPRMMRLTARYADQWNTAWLGEAAELAERIKPLHAACTAEGRDPATIDITVGIDVSFPDLGPTDPYSKTSISGPAEEIAEAFGAYAEAGAAHLITHLTPQNPTAVARLAEAAHLYRTK